MNAVGALMFTWVVKYYALAMARLISGFGTTLFCIYHPLFVETFLKKNKSIWLPVLTLCGPLGTTIGYAVTGGLLSVGETDDKGTFKPYFNWNTPFYALFLACCATFVLIMFIPSNIINIDEC
jgi:MFS family permease